MDTDTNTIDRKSEEYIKQKKLRTKSGKQDHKSDFPNPRKGLFFPEKDFLDFVVIQEDNEIKLATYRYQQLNLEKPKAILILFHTVSSSITHGVHIAKAFAEAGICVVGFDHRGFGNSEGIRGYIENLEVHMEDSLLFVDVIEQIYGKEIKKFCCGISLGGMTSYNLTLDQPERFAGAILMSPAIHKKEGGYKERAIKAMEKSNPKKNFLDQKFENCHRSLSISQEMKKDPCTYTGKLCGSTVYMILNSMNSSNKTFPQYKSPFLIIQGGQDKLVDTDIGYELMEKSASKDKTHWYYEKTWHDIWHEPEIVEIIPRMVEWTLKRI